METSLTVRSAPDAGTVAEIRGLLDRVRGARGELALDEGKLGQLDDARGWTAVLAHEHSRLAGYAHLRWATPGARPRAAAEVVVDPAAGSPDDLSARLVEAAAGEVAAAGGGVLFVWARAVDDPEATAPARAGFAVQRRLARMRTSLDEVPPPPALPDEVAIRRYRPHHDDAALLEVNNAAFAHHPEQGRWTADDLAARRAQDWFDPEDVLLAWRGDELAGFHWTKRHPGDAGVGEVYVLALAPPAQGLGLGRVLLAAGLAHLRERGARTAVLYVDLAEQGAVRLYESAGFAVERVDVCFERTLQPA